MTLQTNQIETVIHDIHEFFTDWVGGRCPGDPDTFRKNALDWLSNDLVASIPGGRSFGKDDFETYMKSIYGANPDFRIKIRDIRVSHRGSELAIANYHEWQRNAKDSTSPNNGRVTTMVVLDRRGDNGPEIVHMHETWLPDENDPLLLAVGS